MMYKLEDMDELDRRQVDMSCATTYPYYHVGVKKHECVYNEIYSQINGKHRKAVLWFVSNAMRAIRYKAKGMKVGLHPSHYTGNGMGIGWRGVKALLDTLEEKGYINIYAGYVEQWKRENGKTVPEYCISSCVEFRPRLYNLCIGKVDEVEIDKLWASTESDSSIIIRNRNTKEELPLKGFGGVKLQRERMKVINDSLKESNIKFKGEDIATVAYKRVYLDNLSIAGRLYAEGGGVQVLPQRLRNEHLTIDDEPVVELDYHSIHPSICYQYLLKDGINIYDVFGKDFSPYGADISFVKTDQDLIDEQSRIRGKIYNPLRQLVKMALMIGINAVDEQSAVGAMSSEIYQDKSRKDREYIGVVGSVPCKRILQAVKEHNGLIENAFFSDRGVYFQHVDSEIMMLIVEKMIQKGYSILCYHDSAIVKASGEQDLYDAMREAWVEVLGDDTFCRIDKK